MRILKRDNIKYELTFVFSFLLIIIIFGLLYFIMLISLPLFGDATIYGRITKNIIDDGLFNITEIKYPPIYSLLQSILFLFFHDNGMKAIILIGILLLSLSLYLLIKEITNNKTLALISIIIVLASPKLIFYSARMYMEVFLSAFFIFTIFLLLRFVEANNKSYLILLSFFTAISAIIKQQGLVILFPAVCAFLIFLYLKSGENKILKGHILIFILIFLLITIAPYWILFHSDGKIMPGIEEFKIGNFSNNLGQKLAKYEVPSEKLEFNKKWVQNINEFNEKYYLKGKELAEEKHILPWEMLISWDKFAKIHSLYITKFADSFISSSLSFIMTILILLGIFLFIYHLFCSNYIFKSKNGELQFSFLIFFVFFNLINYMLFLRNTDQMRYHMFIPILLVIFIITSLYYLICGLINLFSFKFKLVICPLIILILITSLISVTAKDINLNKKWYRSQIYSPSHGGVYSVIEAGKWLNENTKKNEIMWQTCGNELEYYSDREVIGEPWIYFLNETDLKSVFKDSNVKMIILFDSQIVNDENWRNLCWLPKSFSDKIKKNYKQIYVTSFDDIRVYEV